MQGGGTSVTNSRTLNVTAQYQHQSERYLRDDLAYYELLMGTR